MRAHGAEVELIPGSRQDTADAAVGAHGRPSPSGGSVFYASHNWHPFFLQGTKTLAYEVWEDLGFVSPTNVIIPTGAGSNVLGCALGFGELLSAGEIETLPRIFCAQPLRCSPIASAILRDAGVDDGKVAPDEWNTPTKTIAEGTSISAPLRLLECVEAVRASAGGAARITEEAMAIATTELAAIGLYVEPTCAQAVAAYTELLERGAISADETTVIVLTSTGIKATLAIAAMIGAEA